MDTTRYWVWGDLAQAQTDLAAVDAALGYPDGSTASYTAIYALGSKFIAPCTADLPADILLGKGRMTKAEAMAAGVVFE